MEISQLRSFLKIAEFRNFTRAAEACGVTQPALSQQMARLEAEIGCPVFERQGRQVRLTEAGEMLHRRALSIVSLVEDTARQVKDDGETGRLVVGAIPTIAPYYLPRVLARFRAEVPRARVEVNELVTEALIKQCQLGDLDVGVLALPVPVEHAHLELEPLFEEPLWLVLPSTHRLAKGKKPVPIDEIRAEPFLLLDDAHCLSGHIRLYCQSRKLAPVSTGRASQLATVQEMVAHGHGLSFVPEMARKVDASPLRVHKQLDGQAPTRGIGVCWNPYRYQSKLSVRFLNLLRSEAGMD